MPEAYVRSAHAPGPDRRHRTSGRSLAYGRPTRMVAAATLGATLAPWAWTAQAIASPSPVPTPSSPSPSVSAEAAAAASKCRTIRFGATAAADLLGLTTVHSPVDATAALAGVGAGHARATLSTKPTQATAEAGSMNTGSTQVVGATSDSVRQEAPPPVTSGKHVLSDAANLGTVRLGADQLQAKARWHDGYRCGVVTGEASNSSASMTGLTVLPAGGGRSLLHIVNGLGSATTTGLLPHDGHPAAASGASVRLTRLMLFEGTGAPATVQVRTVASLNALATGGKSTSSVRFAPPVLDVTAADGTVTHLADPKAFVDLPVPASLWPLPHGTYGVLRLSLGSVTQLITSTTVHASATALRIQAQLTHEKAVVLPRTGGTGVLDMNIGTLDVTATAAKAALTAPSGYGSGSGSDSPSASTSSSSDPGASGSGASGSGGGTGSGAGSGLPMLPTTGPRLVLVAAAGLLLSGAGYLLMLLARRRRVG